jgi:gliding motility-associated-like protein/uncharacterized repeat protein (TIGR01451 family)
MAKEHIRKKTTIRSLNSGRKFFFYMHRTIAILCLIFCLQYSSDASTSTNNSIKDSITRASNQSFIVNDSFSLTLTSPEGINNAVNPPFFSVSAAILNATCTPTNTGAIDITVDGGTAPYTFLWSNGSVSEDISGLVSGTYTVTVTDDLGNIIEKGFQVKKACLELTKEVVSDPINNGDGSYTLSYTIKVYNAGDIGLTQVMVIDNLTYTFQKGSFFDEPQVISSEFVVNELFDGIEDYNLINETYDVLGPGGVGYITFVVRVTPRDKDEVYTNIASFYAYDTDGMFIAGESSTATVTFSDRPEIALTKVALDTIYDQPGDLINYAVTVVNTGNVTLTSVTVTDPKTGMNELIPFLGVGESHILSTVYTVTQLDVDAGSVTNTVTATGTFSSTIVTAVDTEEVLADQHPDLIILKNSLDTNYDQVSDIIDYEISVTNSGNVSLTNVLVVDPFTQLSQNISTLEVGATVTLTTVFTVTQVQLDAGSFTNTATASSTFSNTLVTDSDSETVPAVRLPSLLIIKTAKKKTFNKSGEIILYDILVRNNGNVTLYNVLVKDPLTGLSSTIPIIPVGGQQIINTSYTIKQSDLLAKSVSNTATASGLFYGKLLIVTDNELITSTQQPPVALDDRNTTIMSVAVSGNVLLNDSDPDGDPLTVTQFLLSGKTYAAGSTVIIKGVGTIVLNANGNYTFIPLPTYVGLVPLIRYFITDGNGNTARAILRLQVTPLVNPPQLYVNDTSICENEFTVLTAISLNVENPIYKWYSDSTMTNEVYVGSTYTTPKLTQSTNYYVLLGGSNLLPSLPAIIKKITVNVIALPAKPTITISGKSILCPGDSTTLISSQASGYQWYKNGNAITGANSQFIVIKEAGDYTVRTIGITNCYSNSSDKVSISIPSLPPTPVIAANKQTYCMGDTATITSSLASINLWYRNGIQLVSDSGRSIKTTEPGIYKLINKTVNGCFTAASNEIILIFNAVPPKPTVIIDGPLIFCEGDYRILKTTIPAGSSVQWYKDGVLMDGKTKDTLRITVGGKYTARFINASGCASPFSDCICTEVKCETDIYTPDIFTPNDDDINDVIKPSIPGIRKFVCFKVYNRWGNLIFYTTDPNKGWDGKYKGANQPAETYMWIVEGFDSSGKKINKSGMLSLMR